MLEIGEGLIPLPEPAGVTSGSSHARERFQSSALPAPNRICTSHVQRKNGTLRQWCRRMTRLTHAFSRKVENLRAALALHFAYHNFCRDTAGLA